MCWVLSFYGCILDGWFAAESVLQMPLIGHICTKLTVTYCSHLQIKNCVKFHMTRLQKILAMLETEPNDTFLRYTLAMEYRKSGETQRSIDLLKELAYKATPRYVPAFFMAAQQLVELDQLEDARSFLRDGIAEARTQNDHHAAAEMSELLAEIGK